jgi:hypothetical protein
MSAWAALPNAKHIDRIFADVRARPAVWLVSYNGNADHWCKAVQESLSRMHDPNSKLHKEKQAALNQTANLIDNQHVNTVTDAVIALMTWNCAYLLDEKPEYVEMLASLGIPEAILLYPACLALATVDE